MQTRLCYTTTDKNIKKHNALLFLPLKKNPFQNPSMLSLSLAESHVIFPQGE